MVRRYFGCFSHKTAWSWSRFLFLLLPFLDVEVSYTVGHVNSVYSVLLERCFFLFVPTPPLTWHPGVYGWMVFVVFSFRLALGPAHGAGVRVLQTARYFLLGFLMGFFPPLCGSPAYEVSPPCFSFGRCAECSSSPPRCPVTVGAPEHLANPSAMPF